MNKQNLCRAIGDTIGKALLYEVTAGIKPGLVDRFDSGSHTDMDIFTFIDSVCAINRYFEKFALIGYEWKEISPACLATIRPLGRECDTIMLEATKGINTHKGAVFSMGIIAACSAYEYRNNGSINIENICSYSSVVVGNIADDFKNLDKKDKLTHGEELYLRYGTMGIRGEVLSGFSSVRNFSLDEVRKLDDSRFGKEDVLVNAVLLLMANVEDTNIISRTDYETMIAAQKGAKDCLKAGGAYTEEGRYRIKELNNLYKSLKISPGGCADLLAVSIAFYFLEKI